MYGASFSASQTRGFGFRVSSVRAGRKGSYGAHRRSEDALGSVVGTSVSVRAVSSSVSGVVAPSLRRACLIRHRMRLRRLRRAPKSIHVRQIRSEDSLGAPHVGHFTAYNMGNNLFPTVKFPNGAYWTRTSDLHVRHGQLLRWRRRSALPSELRPQKA